ncbi:hypothetical protein BJ170DRAFT_677788 [Xylariales sp. AK1849]|nr:hypothetical protein BJ170DRAFT_677788 [Xylariales sp. AK1849]
MHYLNILTVAAAAGLVSAAPTIVDYGVSSNGGAEGANDKRTIVDYGVSSNGGAEGANDKRNSRFEIIDLGVRELTEEELAQPEKRTTDGISSCGSTWMPVSDQSAGSGYNTAVETFCYHATHSLDNLPTVIPPGSKYTVLIKDGYLLTKGTPAQVSFEINNKQKDGNHIVNYDNCQTYLEAMSATNSKCYGKKNRDTKGGSYQVGKEVISYHAFPQGQT